MSKLQPYKITYVRDGKVHEIFFSEDTGSVFTPPHQQAENFIKRNKGKFEMKLYWQDILSPYNWGWKLQKIVPVS